MTTDYHRSFVLLAILALVLCGIEAPPAAAESLEDAVAGLAGSLSGGAASDARSKVAVLEFNDISGYRSAFARFLAEELVTALASLDPPRFEVVERAQLAKVLAEQQLGESALLDPETVASIGKILGLQAIVTGTYANLPKSVKVNARLISTSTASILSVASVSLEKDETLDYLLKQPAGGSMFSNPPGGGGGNPGRQVQASDVFFENDILRATIQSIGLRDDKKQLTLSLQIQNLLGQELLLAVASTNYCAGVVDGQGNKMRYDRINGLKCLNAYAWRDENQYMRLAANSRTTVVMVLTGDALSGNFVSFSSEFLQLIGEKYRLFPVGMSNIEIFE
jgi:TolB-like protein